MAIRSKSYLSKKIIFTFIIILLVLEINIINNFNNLMHITFISLFQNMIVLFPLLQIL